MGVVHLHGTRQARFTTRRGLNRKSPVSIPPQSLPNAYRPPNRYQRNSGIRQQYETILFPFEPNKSQGSLHGLDACFASNSKYEIGVGT